MFKNHCLLSKENRIYGERISVRQFRCAKSVHPLKKALKVTWRYDKDGTPIHSSLEHGLPHRIEDHSISKWQFKIGFPKSLLLSRYKDPSFCAYLLWKIYVLYPFSRHIMLYALDSSQRTFLTLGLDIQIDPRKSPPDHT